MDRGRKLSARLSPAKWSLDGEASESLANVLLIWQFWIEKWASSLFWPVSFVVLPPLVLNALKKVGVLRSSRLS